MNGQWRDGKGGGTERGVVERSRIRDTVKWQAWDHSHNAAGRLGTPQAGLPLLCACYTWATTWSAGPALVMEPLLLPLELLQTWYQQGDCYPHKGSRGFALKCTAQPTITLTLSDDKVSEMKNGSIPGLGLLERHRWSMLLLGLSGCLLLMLPLEAMRMYMVHASHQTPCGSLPSVLL